MSGTACQLNRAAHCACSRRHCENTPAECLASKNKPASQPGLSASQLPHPPTWMSSRSQRMVHKKCSARTLQPGSQHQGIGISNAVAATPCPDSSTRQSGRLPCPAAPVLCGEACIGEGLEILVGLEGAVLATCGDWEMTAGVVERFYKGLQNINGSRQLTAQPAPPSAHPGTLQGSVLHSLRGVRQWYLILLARWTCQESRGTSCLGLIPRMMSCRRAGQRQGRQGRGQAGRHVRRRALKVSAGIDTWKSQHPACLTCCGCTSCQPSPHPTHSQCAGLPAARPCHRSRPARAPARRRGTGG